MNIDADGKVSAKVKFRKMKGELSNLVPAWKVGGKFIEDIDSYCSPKGTSTQWRKTMREGLMESTIQDKPAICFMTNDMISTPKK